MTANDRKFLESLLSFIDMYTEIMCMFVVVFLQIKQQKGTLCWDTLGQGVGGGPIGVSHCHHFGGNQVGGSALQTNMSVPLPQ